MLATNSMFRIATFEGVTEALPNCRYFMGSAEAPKLFLKACEKPVIAWLRDTEHLSRELRAVGMRGKERDTSLADDVVLDGRDGAEGVRRVLDEALKTGIWARNESTRELVLDLRRKGLALSLQDGQLRGGLWPLHEWK